MYTYLIWQYKLCNANTGAMGINATFNNISVLLVKETGVPGENQ